MPWRDARWQSDPSFRRKAQLLLAGGVVASVGVGLMTTLVAWNIVLALIFGRSHTGFVVDANGNGANQTFPIVPISPIAQGSQPPPYAVAHSSAAQPTPTVLASPTVTGIGAPTPTILPCPPTSPSPALSGAGVRDGTGPAPMIANCPAVLYLAAPRQTYAPVSVTLSFGRLTQANCTITINTYSTDGQGNVAIPFTVPDSSCIRGTIMTNGTITVGNDSSANVNLPAEG